MTQKEIKKAIALLKGHADIWLVVYADLAALPGTQLPGAAAVITSRASSWPRGLSVHWADGSGQKIFWSMLDVERHIDDLIYASV